MEDVPKKINEVLDYYFALFEKKSPTLLEAFYLYGSTSLGDFKYGFSDIDFIAVISRTVNDTDVKTLKEIHKDMQREFPKAILDGFYITKDDMKSLNSINISCIRFNEGKFHGYREFNKNSIDAYQLKKYGLTIKGPKMKDIDFTVDWNILLNNMRTNLNTYWLDWLSDCRRFPSIKYIGLLFSLHMVEWGVLGISRLYYTFKEKDITSKVGAGEYALSKVPQRFHKIINESMRLRKDNKKSYYNSIFERRKDALSYIEFMIQECNKHFQ
ncbi:hypothetical protein J6TS2_21820 [Heyndrickxia sporothermodurans]|nr:hypothetical protein J6TS2_21820 [Heyndrickxia sporothermodurans]